MMSPKELRQLLSAASTHVRAFILLGLNCGMGNSDIAKMSASNLKGEWLDYPRPKTAVDRRCWLWPETRPAIEQAINEQSNAKHPSDQGTLFLTRLRRPWTGATLTSSPISAEYRKLLDSQDLYRRGRTFYGLRHIHRTIADEVRDQPAANYIMGHADNSMAGQYRERIGDDRIKAICEHIHDWLFEEPEEA